MKVCQLISRQIKGLPDHLVKGVISLMFASFSSSKLRNLPDGEK